MKFWIFLILFPLSTFSQNAREDFINIGVNEGLSQSSVYSVYQDKIGYIWFGTADGLNRYDGKEIKVYRPFIAQPQNGFSNFIRGNLCEDKKGNIWYANQTGIFCYNRISDSVEVIHPFKDKSFFEEKLVLIDSAQSLWFFNINRGITSYNIRNNQFVAYPFPFSVYHNLDQKGDLQCHYLNSSILFRLNYKDGYYSFNITGKKYEHHLPGFKIQSVFPLKNKTIIITGDSVDFYSSEDILFKKNRLPILNGATINSFYSIAEDGYNRIWMASLNNGLFCYDVNKEKFYHYYDKSSGLQTLPIRFTRTLFIDRTDNLWIGTDGSGVYKLDLKPARFNLFPQNEENGPFLNNYFVKCIYEEKDGKVYIGTLHGLDVFNPENYSIKKYKLEVPEILSSSSETVSAILKDSKGRLWIGGNFGVAFFNEKTGTFNRIKLKNEIEKLFTVRGFLINHFTQMNDGTIVAASSMGLIYFNISPEQDITVSYPRFKGFVTAYTSDVRETSPGELWYTAPSNGLYHIKLQKDSLVFKERFFTSIDLRCIHQDENDKQILWVGSGIGLIRFNTETKQSIIYDAKAGLTNSFVYGILEEDDKLWLSTNGGIFRFNKTTHQFTRYDEKYGLQSNEFNTGAYYKGESGYLYFGGIKGLNWFKPSQINSSSFKPVVAVSEVQINDAVHNNDTSFFYHRILKLNYNENDLSFKLAALDFTKPEANKFAYQLEGWDKKMIITDHNMLRYNKLQPGKYVLVIKASNSDDTWSDSQKIFITILPPFWKTWWFYLLIALALISSIIIITRYISYNNLKEKIRELEKQKALEVERTRISREMHDDIGAGLTQIVLMSEAAKRDNPKQKALDEIATTSRQLVGNISEIIWSLKPENKSLEQLIVYTRELLYKMLEVSGMNYSIDFPEKVENILLNSKQTRNILLVSKEIVHNCIKHSKATTISIQGIIENHDLKMEINDNGQGFDPTIIYPGNGLKNIKHRINEIGGDLQIESNPGDGAKFFYRIPLKSH